MVNQATNLKTYIEMKVCVPLGHDQLRALKIHK